METEGVMLEGKEEGAEDGGVGDMYDDVGEGHWNEGPDMIMSLINVSIGVFPTSLTKNSCSMTAGDTVLKLGSRSSNFPNLMGWFGYCVRQYSSRAH